MLQHSVLLCLLVFITASRAQETTTLNPDWNGDPGLCTVLPEPTSAPNPPPLPQFYSVAEFGLEHVTIGILGNFTVRKLGFQQHLYDYNKNSLIIVRNENNFIDVEYFYYNIMKKSKYYGRQYCVVDNITRNVDMDGTSGIMMSDGSWHLRTLNEYLLFSSERTNPPIRPVYLGKGVVRGIAVDRWQACIIDRSLYVTQRRIWSFAERGVQTPTGVVGDYAHPVQAEISTSRDFPNGTRFAEEDEIYNILSYKNFIAETNDQLAPPKGVFCSSGPDQALISLQDVGAGWPRGFFSVRVEASTSRGSQWQSFHLRYESGRGGESRRLRYDYMPPGSEDFVSVMHDYSNNITYTIDRQVGSCRVDYGVEIPDVSPTRDPIRFFIKNEAHLIFDPPQKAWEFNGLRPCRGNTIKCTILTTSRSNFPAMVDVDTGESSGETWDATNIEYAWSMHSVAGAFFNRTRFDYPITLYMKLFRLGTPGDVSPANIRTEDIEYEFFELSRERRPGDFDVSACYRSLGYEYLHLMFVLKLNRGEINDGNQFDRRELERYTYFVLANRTEVSWSRISEVEIDHERTGNDVTVFFTLLGRTPTSSTSSGFINEITAAEARDRLRQAIDKGDFAFDFNLADNSTVQFRAESGSLKASKLYMSTHAAGRAIVEESYSSGAQALAVIVGLLLGLVVGVIIAAVVRIVRKEPMPAAISISNPMPKINFHAKKTASSDPSSA